MRVVVMILCCTLLCCGVGAAGQGGLTPDDREASEASEASEADEARLAPAEGGGREAPGDLEREKERYRAVYAVLAEPETARNLADYARNLFEELRRRGFSGPDALRLTANLPLPQPLAPGAAPRQ